MKIRSFCFGIFATIAVGAGAVSVAFSWIRLGDGAHAVIVPKNKNKKTKHFSSIFY